MWLGELWRRWMGQTPLALLDAAPRLALYCGRQAGWPGQRHRSFTWTITVLSLTNPGTQSAAFGTTINPLQIVASGLPSGYSWTFTATNLPSGLSINAATGVISGTLAETDPIKKYSVTVTASDGDGASVSVTFTFNVT